MSTPLATTHLGTLKIWAENNKGATNAHMMFDSKKLDGHKVSVELLKRGVYAKETHHSTVRIAPALTIEAHYVDDIAEQIRDVIKSL